MPVQPKAVAIKPAHSSGKVMLSGSSVVSQSINARASKTALKPHHTKAAAVGPQWAAFQANSNAVVISTNG